MLKTNETFSESRSRIMAEDEKALEHIYALMTSLHSEHVVQPYLKIVEAFLLADYRGWDLAGRGDDV